MYHRILVPLDGSPTAERGLREAVTLAVGQKEKATLLLLHVVAAFPVSLEMLSAMDAAQIRQGLSQYGERLLAKARQVATDAGASVETALRDVGRGRCADAIVDEAGKRGCDLIVMGTHGRRGFNRFVIGSDAELVVRTSPVPVLLVHHEDRHR